MTRREITVSEYDIGPADDEVGDDASVRPVEPFAIAKQAAVRTLTSALLSHVALSEDGASAIAQAVEDPAAVRRQVQAPDRIKVFGGTLLTVSSRVSVMSVIPHVTNGRVIGATPYPASTDGAAYTDAKFWAERDLSTNQAAPAELLLQGGTRARVVHALELADVELRAHNSWEESIRLTGIFAPITLAALRVDVTDAEPVVVLTAVDGSSRVASAHRILGLRPGDPLYGTLASPRVARGRLQELMGLLQRSRDDVSEEDLALVRAATVPATIVIGFEADQKDGTDLVDALDEYVALLHLEPARPWAVPARENKIADSVIQALRDADEVDDNRAAWLAGMVPLSTGPTSGLSQYADERAAEIVDLLRAPSWTPRGKAIGLGIRRLSLSKRTRRMPKAAVAASLALRTLSTTNLNRRKHAAVLLQRIYLSRRLWESAWQVSGDAPHVIRDEALTELSSGGGTRGPELAVLASYHLAVSGVLGTEEPGSVVSDSTGRSRPSDKRDPARVVEAMLDSEQGIHALCQAIEAGRNNAVPMQIADDGGIARTVNGSPVGAMTNFWLRGTFREERTSTVQGDVQATPLQQLENSFRRLKEAVYLVSDAVREIEAVVTQNGGPLVDQEGMDPVLARDVRGRLDDAIDRVSGYRRVWQRRHPQPHPATEVDAHPDE